MKTIKAYNTGKDILVDDFNYERLKHLEIQDLKYGLYVNKYNNFINKYFRIPLTKIILLTDQEVVDHIDRNYLNNQISNLRPCTRSQNMMNRRKKKTFYGAKTTSKYKGVSWAKYNWRADINIERRKISLGCFESEEKAAEEYNKAAILYHKEFAVLNVIKYEI